MSRSENTMAGSPGSGSRRQGIGAEFWRLAEALDADMVSVPGGPFPFGLRAKQREALAQESRVHPDMLHFHSPEQFLVTPPFHIDRYPVTRLQFLRFLRETGYRIKYNGWLVGWTELADFWDASTSERALRPVVGVNSEDAEQYARWLGKRLPTEIEREKAARGENGQLYPWGNNWRGFLNRGGIPLSYCRPVGVARHDCSPYGVADLGGLVTEWVRRVLVPLARDGCGYDPSLHVLAGGSLLHTQAYSRLPTNRLAWSPLMRIYNAGFRCATDEPRQRPAEVHLPDLHAERPRPLKVAFRQRAAAIQLEPHDWATVKILVPWFPQSMWVLDCPETGWGPFGGANDWPDGPPPTWRTPWEKDGQRLCYRRTSRGKCVDFAIWAEGALVRYRIAVRGLTGNLGSLCCKTFSPFFSSQEGMTQCKWRRGRLVPCCQLPADASALVGFAWSLGQLQDGMVVYRSYAHDAFVVFFGPPGTSGGGNGWPPCTHFFGEPQTRITNTHEGAILFFVGTEDELRNEARRIARGLFA